MLDAKTGTPKRTAGTFPSRLINKDGGHTTITIKYLDGMPKGLFFFDIDKTLVHIEDVYKIIRKTLWPNVDTTYKTIDELHLAGFQLGTMWHEMLRMKWLNENFMKFNTNVFTESFFSEGGEGYGIENADHPLHNEADIELRRFDMIATKACQTLYKEKPEIFEQSKIKPLFHLLNLYKHLGIPMVGMSANPRNFIHEVCRCTGLSDYFLDCGNDTDTLGMKEHKMVALIAELEKMGIKIPYSNLYIFGDSPNGDVGSGPRFEKLVKNNHADISVRGILVCENEEDFKNGKQKIVHAGFKDSVEALLLNRVTSQNGRPNIGLRHRKQFLKQL